MTLHPDIQLPDAETLAKMSPEDLAAALNGPNGNGLEGTLGQRIGIEFLRASQEELTARMPVEGNRQPAGRLHGGATLALAEELASVGSWINIDFRRETAVGVDVNCTHIRGVTGGYVTATARRSYRGRTLMVWEIEVQDERGKTTTLARCTCNIVKL